MSANNQVVLKEHKGKWYVWDNIMAETWEEGTSVTLHTQGAEEFTNLVDASVRANELSYDTEYGVGDHLIKDCTEIIVKDE